MRNRLQAAMNLKGSFTEDFAIALCDAERHGPVAVCAFELQVSGQAPEWVELIPAGEFAPRDSRAPWNNSSPEAVLAASRALAMDLPVDYEHQTDYATQNGQPAPAAGWIKEMQVRAGAIWGRVEWTERARAMLAAREYRYLSPVFGYTTDGRVVTHVLRAALTNDPALHLTALTRKEQSVMDPRLLKALGLLGLPETADEAALAKAIGDLRGAETALATVAKAAGIDKVEKPDDTARTISIALAAAKDASPLVAIAKAAGLPETATAEEIAAAVKSAKSASPGGFPDPKQFVPRSEFDQVKTALATLQSDSVETKASAAVDDAIQAGKVTPGQRDWAMAYARKDPEGFADYVGAAPAIVTPGSSSANKRPAPGSALTAEELAVCKVTGVDPEAFKKQRDALTEEIA